MEAGQPRVRPWRSVSRLATTSVVLALLLSAVPVEPARRLPMAEADSVLAPGDFLFQRMDARMAARSAAIGALVRGGSSLSEPGRIVEDAIHVAIYMGDGRTVEAYGTRMEDARVAVWSLVGAHRPHAVWRVLRHRDGATAAAVAEVARRWATGRIRFAAPLVSLVRSPSWTPEAQHRAAVFAAAFSVAGGPPEIDAMFCSELAQAVLQSAVGRSGGAAPPEARLDARASPARLLRAWRDSGAFEELGIYAVE